jgi:hypothetical protein
VGTDKSASVDGRLWTTPELSVVSGSVESGAGGQRPGYFSGLARAWEGPLPARISGLSARTVFAIQGIEVLAGDYYLFPDATDRALRRYREFLEPPGRKPLYPQDAGMRT